MIVSLFSVGQHRFQRYAAKLRELRGKVSIVDDIIRKNHEDHRRANTLNILARVGGGDFVKLDDVVDADLVRRRSLKYVSAGVTFFLVPAILLAVPQSAVAEPLVSSRCVASLAASVAVKIARLVEHQSGAETRCGRSIRRQVVVDTVLEIVLVKVTMPADYATVAFEKLIDTSRNVEVIT